MKGARKQKSTFATIAHGKLVERPVSVQESKYAACDMQAKKKTRSVLKAKARDASSPGANAEEQNYLSEDFGALQMFRNRLKNHVVSSSAT